MSDVVCDDDGENENSLTFSWSAVENASGYQVSTDGGNTYGDPQEELSYTWTNLLPSTQYTIYVKAVGDGTNYLTSEAKSATGTTKEGEITGVEWVETPLANLTSNDVFVIVGNGYAMTNNNGTSSAPAAQSVSVANGKLVDAPTDNIKWNVSGDATNGYTFYPNGSTTTWLYCSTTADTGSNNNMKVGGSNTATRKVFALNSNNQLETKDNYVKRYLCIYNCQDWRGYINTTTSNSVCPAIKFYKKVGNEPAPTTYSVTIATDIQNGSVNASKTSGIEEGESITLTATPTDATTHEFNSWDITGLTLTDAQKKTNPLTIQMPASNITVSATFKEHDDEGTIFTWSASGNTSLDDGSENATDGSGTVVSWAQNGSNTKVALNTDGMRLYQKNMFTVSNASKKITKIEFTIKVNAKNGAFPAPSVEVGNLTSITSASTSMTWTGSSNEVAVTMGTNSGNIAISKIVVTYE